MLLRSILDVAILDSGTGGANRFGLAQNLLSNTVRYQQVPLPFDTSVRGIVPIVRHKQQLPGSCHPGLRSVSSLLLPFLLFIESTSLGLADLSIHLTGLEVLITVCLSSLIDPSTAF